MHIYEYLFTAVIIVSILLASSIMIVTLSEPTLDVSEKEQLKVAAQKIMAQLLLDPGDPPDWGSNININESNLRTFGLAKHGETTRQSYALDPDKVLRLNSTNPLFISPSSVINLLNLGNDYGLALNFSTALNVDIQRDIALDRYNVSVSSEYGELPIAGARVAAKMYYATDQTISSENKSGTTSYDGKCTIDFSSISTEMKVLIVVVDYYGVRVTKVRPVGSNVTPAHVVGNYLFLNGTSGISGNEVYEVIVTKKDAEYAIENVTSRLDFVSPGKFNLAHVEPSAIAILAVSEDGSSLVLASRDATLIYSSISGFDISQQSLPMAYSLERTVMIGDSTYIARLYLWRLSW
jgi:hypothetical protein